MKITFEPLRVTLDHRSTTYRLPESFLSSETTGDRFHGCVAERYNFRELASSLHDITVHCCDKRWAIGEVGNAEGLQRLLTTMLPASLLLLLFLFCYQNSCVFL